MILRRVSRKKIHQRVMTMATRAMALAKRVAVDKEFGGNVDKEGNSDGVKGGGQAMAMRVVGNKECSGGKSNSDGDKSVGQATARKRAMAMDESGRSATAMSVAGGRQQREYGRQGQWQWQ